MRVRIIPRLSSCDVALARSRSRHRRRRLRLFAQETRQHKLLSMRLMRNIDKDIGFNHPHLQPPGWGFLALAAIIIAALVIHVLGR